MYGTRCDKCGQWSDGDPAARIFLDVQDGDQGLRVSTPIDLCEDCSPAIVQMLAAIARTERKADATEIIMSMGESRVGDEHDGSEGWLSETDS
jgi:hypothetical protein